MNPSLKYLTTQDAAAQVLDAFYLEGRVISEAEYALCRDAMRMVQRVSAMPATLSRAAIAHPTVVTLAIRAQAKRGARAVAMHQSSDDPMSSAKLYELSPVKRPQTAKVFQAFTESRKPSCGHPT